MSKEKLRQRLIEERAALLAEIEGLTEDEAARIPPGSEWSIKDVLAHLSSAEGAAIDFIRCMVEEDRPRQVPPELVFDLDRWNASQVRKRREWSLPRVLDELRTQREALLRSMDELTDEQLSRRGIHAAWGEVSVADQLRILHLHDQMHRKMITQLKAVLPVSAER